MKRSGPSSKRVKANTFQRPPIKSIQSASGYSWTPGFIQRMAKDREAASLLAYLASPLAAATNGDAVRVEGGILRGIF